MDPSNKDLGSVLAHVETLQKQLAQKESELRESKDRENTSSQEAARRQAEQLSSVNSKLTEAKRESMQQDFNNTIRNWVKDLDSKQVSEQLKEVCLNVLSLVAVNNIVCTQEFLASCENFAKKGDDTGVWKVVCCASAAHQHHVNTIQKLTDDYNNLKKTVDGGQFQAEESRKRKEMEPAAPAIGGGVWEQLEGMCRSY